MKEDQELKHVCKFCSKRFLCGRSLGGHMRSHMINDISALTDGTKVTRKKLPALPIKNGANNTEAAAAAATGYGLRENPKKTWRLLKVNSSSDPHQDTSSSLVDKLCKECGKVFPSWKALFGHMKCHATNNNNDSLEEQQDSWTSGNDNSNNNNNHKLVTDSQSDNETTAAPNRRKRSKRRGTRYLGNPANSSSLSFANNNNSSSISEIEQEQEEVAMCLMMLSRDVGQWGGLNSVAESSDNNSSVFLETNKLISVPEGKSKSKNSVSDKKSEIGKLEVVDDSKAEIGKSEFFSVSGNSSKKRKLEDSSSDPGQFRSDNSSKQLTTTDAAALDSELFRNNSDKGSKFECATCNKVFHSYQALGGHRASHKKIKGCFASRIDSSENSIDTQASPDPAPATTTDCDNNNNNNNEQQQLSPPIDEDCDNNKGETCYGVKKSKGQHECPICLKVFPSGQALGGHKRSHLVGAAAAGIEGKSNTTTITIQEPPLPPIRDFLDLNLPPAPVEEEANGISGFNPWWIAGTHKHEPLLGLISN